MTTAMHHSRSTPLGARGEPMVWLTGLCLSLCLFMILALLAVVVVQGSRAFWPVPIDTVTLRDGTTIMGMPTRDEAYDPLPEELAEIAALRSAGTLDAKALAPDGRPMRRLYRVGNREFTGEPFRWVPLHRIVAVERDPHATLLERQAWGVWIGTPQALVEVDGSAGGAKRTTLAEGPEPTIRSFAALHAESLARQRQIEALKTDEVGAINARIERERLRLRSAEIRLEPAGGARKPVLSVPAFVVVTLLAVAALVIGAVRLRMLLSDGAVRPHAGGVLVTTFAWVIALGGGLFAAMESPWSRSFVTPEQVLAARSEYDRAQAELQGEYDAIRARISEIEAQDARFRLLIASADGKLAPIRQTEPGQPMLISQVVRVVQPNVLDWTGKLGVYASRWREFLLDNPRESNTEGGIFPVIFGTVILTLLLSVAVVPLGVIAALYLREYATQGLLTSFVRIAVNNLAGVPSIVYGVFGLGFFCYSVGQFVDSGPRDPWPVAVWWGIVGAMAALVLLAAWVGLVARPEPGKHPRKWQKRIAWAAFLLWAGCAGLAVMAIAGTPYFDGFFRAREPNPTFGAKGLLWSALTLALLTLPVVIVATEEAISAVPRSLREGSYACGASKWQTIRRIVLPRAMPGIMTGMILAMARGAGEVAPLMLVGAVKLAPELVVSKEFPFLHLDRSFMHLGFHIYDVGFQSPDSEAARPLVWCTTFVLIVIVVLLTSSAIKIRSNLRRKYLGDAF